MSNMPPAFVDQPRAVIGITTSSSSTNRDTLGVLVASVRTGSPADKAGIEEGNRIASVDGVSLKLATGDVGDYEMANAMMRRLTRELDKLKPGDDVDLRVVANGQTKTVKVKTMSPDDLYKAQTRPRDSDRATLGLSIGLNGSPRDSIGVFVIGVDDNGPAAKAGIEEGARIVSINGVDVRSRHSVDDDDVIFRSTSTVGRLEREVSKLKAGDVAKLRVFYNGQYKDVNVTAGRADDRPRTNHSITVIGGDNFLPLTRPEPPMERGFSLDMPEINDRVQHALERAQSAVGGSFSGFGGNRVRW
jgi:C-terminal processing protease CtpA/Prc